MLYCLQTQYLMSSDVCLLKLRLIAKPDTQSDERYSCTLDLKSMQSRNVLGSPVYQLTSHEIDTKRSSVCFSVCSDHKCC